MKNVNAHRTGFSKLGMGRLLSGLLLTTALAGPAAAESLIIEDFESYLGGQIIGVDWQSTPWARFGPATMDNVVTTASERAVLSGGLSGQYSVAWPAHYGAIRRVFSAPTDLSSYDQATVKAKSNNTKTRAHLKIAISNGVTTFTTVATGRLTDVGQEFTFSLAVGAMVRSDGDDSYAEVVRNAHMIGLDFISGVEAYTEVIVFDDLVLHRPDSAAPSQADAANQTPSNQQTAEATQPQ